MTATQHSPQERPTALTDRVTSALENQFILSQTERMQLVFPALWVAEIVRIERSQILELPFYDSSMAGIIHHRGRALALVNSAQMLKVGRNLARERAIAIVLNDLAGAIANIGIIVDRAIGSINRDELPAALFDPNLNRTDTMQMMHPALIPPGLWQPKI